MTDHSDEDDGVWEEWITQELQGVDRIMGSNLTLFRTRTRTNLEELSQRSGVPVQTIKEHEAGMRTMTLHDLARYAAAFDSNPMEFLIRLLQGAAMGQHPAPPWT